MKLKYIPLGSAQEVGRSCHIIQSDNLLIMFDCGIKPRPPIKIPQFEHIFRVKDGKSKKNNFSNKNETNNSTNGDLSLSNGTQDDETIDLDFSILDIVCLSHFHVDHSTLLPFITSCVEFGPYRVVKPFTGKILMTRPTRAILSIQLNEFVKWVPIYDDYTGMNKAIEYIEFNEEKQFEIKGKICRITAFRAGHVIGAAMFKIVISNDKNSRLSGSSNGLQSLSSLKNGTKLDKNNLLNCFKKLDTFSVLYTGDFCVEGEIHLPGVSFEDKTFQTERIRKKLVENYTNNQQYQKKDTQRDLQKEKVANSSKMEKPENILPNILRPDLMITESTYASVNRQARMIKINLLISHLMSAISRNAIILFPCYALGRLHELNCMINRYLPEKYKKKCEFLFAGNVMEQGIQIYERYSDYLNEGIAEQMRYIKPFSQEYIEEHNCFYLENSSNYKKTTEIENECQNYRKVEDSPSQKPKEALIIFSSPAELLKGTSYRIFQSIQHAKNLVILPGSCCSESDMVKSDEITKSECQIEQIGFSAHSDSNTIIRFIKHVQPKKVALVHGKEYRMYKFRNSIEKELKNEKNHKEKEEKLPESTHSDSSESENLLKEYQIENSDDFHDYTNNETKISLTGNHNESNLSRSEMIFLNTNSNEKFNFNGKEDKRQNVKRNLLEERDTAFLNKKEDLNEKKSDKKWKRNVLIPKNGECIGIKPKKYLILHSKEKLEPGNLVCKFFTAGEHVFIDKIQKLDDKKE